MSARNRIFATLAAAALAGGIATGPVAADPWKDESGHGRGGYKYEEKYGPGGYKREWKSGNCKYEYKEGRGGVKEEYKCDGRGPGYRTAWGPPRYPAPVHAGRGPGAPLDLGLGRCNRELIGQVLGGAAGAAAGSQIGSGSGRLYAIAGGTILGVLLGGEVGREMDRADHMCVDQALEYAPDGRAIVWNEPGGDTRVVTPVETRRDDTGRYCREYTARATVGGKPVETWGTACRQPNGSWEIVS